MSFLTSTTDFEIFLSNSEILSQLLAWDMTNHFPSYEGPQSHSFEFEFNYHQSDDWNKELVRPENI